MQLLVRFDIWTGLEFFRNGDSVGLLCDAAEMGSKLIINRIEVCKKTQKRAKSSLLSQNWSQRLSELSLFLLEELLQQRYSRISRLYGLIISFSYFNHSFRISSDSS